MSKETFNIILEMPDGGKIRFLNVQINHDSVIDDAIEKLQSYKEKIRIEDMRRLHPPACEVDPH